MGIALVEMLRGCSIVALVALLPVIFAVEDAVGPTSLEAMSGPEPLHELTVDNHSPPSVDEDGVPNHYKHVDHKKMGYEIHSALPHDTMNLLELPPISTGGTWVVKVSSPS